MQHQPGASNGSFAFEQWSYIACCACAFLIVLVEANKQANMGKVWQRQEQQVERDPGGLPFP